MCRGMVTATVGALCEELKDAGKRPYLVPYEPAWCGGLCLRHRRDFHAVAGAGFPTNRDRTLFGQCRDASRIDRRSISP